MWSPLTPGRRDAVVVVLLALLALAFVAPALPGTGKILGGEDLLYFRAPLSELRPPSLVRPSNSLLADPVEVFHPDLEWSADQIRSGHLPLWNPLVGAGWPQLASQQTAVLFPLTWLAYATRPIEAIGLIAALRILIAGLGTFWFCRATLSLRRISSLFAAVSFAACTYQIDWLEHPHGNVYALIPLLLLTADRAVVRSGPGPVAAFGATIGLAMLGGHPQSVLIAGFLVVAYLAWRVAPPGRRALGERLPAGRALGRLAGAVALGLAAAAVVLLPLLEFIGASTTTQRGGLGGVSPRALLSLVAPEFWGRPEMGSVLVGPINYFERTFYVGAPALVVGVAALALRPTALQWLFGGLAAGGALLALDVPVLTHITRTTVPFSLVDMTRMLIVPSLCLAILAGLGMERLLGASRRERRRVLLAGVALVVLPAVAVLLVREGGVDQVREALGAIPAVGGEPVSEAGVELGSVARWIVMSGIAVLLLSALTRFPRSALAIAVALVALQAADLIEIGRGMHPIVDERPATAAASGPLAQAVREQGSSRTTADDFYLAPDGGERYGLRDMRVRGQPTIERIDRLYVGYTGYLPRTFDADGPRAGDVMDAFGVRQLLTGARPADLPDPDLRLQSASADDRLYRNAGALPRAYASTSWRYAKTKDDALAMSVFSPTSDLRNAPVIEAPADVGYVARPGSATARITEDGETEVAVEVDADKPARLILLDAYFPGWGATVNGRDAEISPANGAFRSVPVPAGRSHVVFRYAPRSVLIGGIVSVVAWIVLAGLALVHVRRRRVAAA